jgi:hypothetical protein
VRKIPTVFRRNPDDMAHVLEEVNPGCEWVLEGEGQSTRKYDGTCVMLDEDGDWWARREVKPGKAEPAGFVPEETDPNTGKTVGWEPIEQSSFAKFHAEALGNPYERRPVGTYELCGPKINGNPEKFAGHVLIRHADADLVHLQNSLTYDVLKGALTGMKAEGYEGIVWHHPDGRMAKLKGRDFT